MKHRYLYLAPLCLVAIQAQRLTVELCDSLPCANGGKCYEVFNPADGVLMDPQCICPSNFTGDLCEASAPCNKVCLNGGTCSFGDYESWWLEDAEFLEEILQVCSFEPGGLDLQTCPAIERSEPYCQCPPSVYGSNCETVCDLQCENNGICEPWGNQATCSCEYPFYGDLCQESCSKGCQNGGRCVAYDFNNDTVMEQTCLCPSNFTGDLCETPKPCTKACVNGGSCQHSSNWWFEEAAYFDELFDRIFYDCQRQTESFDITDCFDLYSREYCQCPIDHFGEFCQVTCDLNCLNGGSCQVRGDEPRCSCLSGFFGDTCEDSCDLDCSNGGICVAYDTNNDGTKEKHCLCPSNWTGVLCTEPRTCQSECFNGGTCVLDYEDWWLNDEPEFIDGILEEVFGECLHGSNNNNNNNQENIFTDQATGIFEDCLGMGMFGREYCQCPPNAWGSQCENVCDLDCGANGNCTYSRFEDKRCVCKPGYSGESCQYECTLNCVNNGFCVSDGVSEYCQCSPFYEGDLCQTQKSCSKTCANGGSCLFIDWFGRDEEFLSWCLDEKNGDCPELAYMERCNCTRGFVGSDCSEPCPCQNGGICSTYYRRGLQSTNKTTDGGSNNYWPPDSPLNNMPEDEEHDGAYYCTCPFGFYGHNCQFKFGDRNCSLQCRNGGYCENDYIWGSVGDGSDVPNQNQHNDHGNHNATDGDRFENYNSNGSNQNQDHSDHDHTGAVEGDHFMQERCVCPSNFTGPTCGEFVDACFNLCQNGICSTAVSSTKRFGGRSLESLWVPDPNNPNSDFNPSHDDFGLGHFGAFCQCDQGFSGEYCERKECGSGYCANGAACIELPSGQTTSSGDDYVCDCSVASLGRRFGNTTFIGRHCDGAVYSECFGDDKKNPNENWECANYGRCFYGSSGPECRCDWGWEGPRCETNSSDAKDIAWSQCTLACENGGMCLKGVDKPIANMFSRFLEATGKTKLFDYEPSNNFEYCYCPTGFFGVACEKQYELCGDGDHICFHGSTCEQTGGEWTCDCTGTESAGLYCMYEATDNCSDADDGTFCTNGATCGADKKCSCLEGWEGDNCEVEMKAATIQGGGEKWSAAKSTRPFSAMLSFVVACMTLFMI